MPLSDSLGSAQNIRLTKMNSVPTTEDLKYALVEAKKRVGKSVELPFDHPINHGKFLVEIVVPPKGATNWTFSLMEGENPKRLWVRASDDVLMIQNKIKTEAQYAGSQAQAQKEGAEGEPRAASSGSIPISMPASPAAGQPIILGGSSDGKPTSLPPSISQAAPPPVDPSLFMPAQTPMAPDQGADSPFASLIQQPPALDAFLVQPPAPTFSFVTQERPAPAPAPVQSGPQKKQAATEAGALHSRVEESEEDPLAPPPKPKPAVPKMPLPQPTKLDKALLNQIYAALSDAETGLTSFPAFVFFLFREFARYQKDNASLAMVVFEVAMQQGNEIMELPAELMPPVVNCIRSGCSPLDVVAYVGGTEFAVLLASTDGAGAMDFAVAMSERLSELVLPDAPDAVLLAAFGAASIPETCNHPEILVTAARQAKEMAKGLPEPYLLFPVQD